LVDGWRLATPIRVSTAGAGSGSLRTSRNSVVLLVGTPSGPASRALRSEDPDIGESWHRITGWQLSHLM
jgi:hypothetical protein